MGQQKFSMTTEVDVWYCDVGSSSGRCDGGAILRKCSRKALGISADGLPLFFGFIAILTSTPNSSLKVCTNQKM